MRLLAGAEGAAADDDPVAVIPADLEAAHAPAALNGEEVLTAVQSFVTENEESTQFDAIGGFLSDLLLRDEVAERWDALRQQYSGELHTLLDIQPRELRAVPWELIFRDDRRLFLGEEAGNFARVQGLRHDAAQELVPLRLLVVEGKQDDDELGTATEIRGIKSALPDFHGRIDAEFLREPSKDELLQAFKRVRPHIFHFMGHGVLDAAKEPALLVGGWSLTSRFVRESLRPMPRVVVLNACRSGEAARAGSLTAKEVRALTDTFLASGAAAAIGMQGDVRGRAAALFGAGLYRALGSNPLLDRAVAQARKLMADSGGNDQARDWCLPSLTLSVVPEQVLPLACGISDDDREHVESKLFKEIDLFVDRTPIRWELAAAADPDEGEGDPARLVLIVGDMEAGKTWLVNWIRTRCALRGRRMRYVDFTNTGVYDFVRALECIRDAPEDLASLAGPAEGAFDRFTWDLGHLVNGKIPPEEIAGDPPEITDRLQLGGDNEERVFDSFRAALEAATDAQPLLLIFDHVDGILKTDFQTRIFRHLITPLVNGNPPNVRLIVVLSSEQQRAYWPSDAVTLGTRVDVKLFSLEDYKASAEDVLLAMGEEFGEMHELLIKGVLPFIQPPASPKELRMVERIVARS